METVARASSPRGELVLSRRDDGHLELRANGVFVMDTLEHTSERALAGSALALVTGHSIRVLVGGLGLGHTLGAVLADSRVTRCTVVEIEPALVGWLRDGTVPDGPALLDDPRIEVQVADVADALRGATATYDVVLLDVDNGPGYLVHDANAALYTEPALATMRAVLAPGGCLVVWSAAAATKLERALQEVFGNAHEERFDVPGHARVGQYFLYSAHR